MRQASSHFILTLIRHENNSFTPYYIMLLPIGKLHKEARVRYRKHFGRSRKQPHGTGKSACALPRQRPSGIRIGLLPDRKPEIPQQQGPTNNKPALCRLF